jgi:hypothetical protein
MASPGHFEASCVRFDRAAYEADQMGEEWQCDSFGEDEGELGVEL